MVKIELIRHRTRIEELLDLFQVSFGHDMSAELWNWKYFLNPLVSADPVIIVAISKGKIVGARPLLPAEIWIGDEKTKAAQPCDTMVHPEHRREGIFYQMNVWRVQSLQTTGY